MIIVVLLLPFVPDLTRCFRQPSHPLQRRYEALRSYPFEGVPMPKPPVGSANGLADFSSSPPDFDAASFPRSSGTSPTVPRISPWPLVIGGPEVRADSSGSLGVRRREGCAFATCGTVRAPEHAPRALGVTPIARESPHAGSLLRTRGLAESRTSLRPWGASGTIPSLLIDGGTNAEDAAEAADPTQPPSDVAPSPGASP